MSFEMRIICILRKCDNKCKLQRAIEGKLEHQQNFTLSYKKQMATVDFMVCAKKVKIKQDHAKIFGEFCQKVQNMIQNLGKDYQQIDIVFFIY